MLDRKRIGEILVDLRVLTTDEVDRVLDALGKRDYPVKFGQLAQEMGLVRAEHILAALAVQMRLFPNIQGMSLRKLMGRLGEPIRTPPRVPLRQVRARLAAKGAGKGRG